MSTRAYESLEVWKRSVDLAVEVYKLTEAYPREELYGLTSQIRRAVVSVSSNIAEGVGRNSKGEQLNFIGFALGSLYEVGSLLAVSYRLGYINDENYNGISSTVEDVGRLLNGFKNYLTR
ncbi:MAG: four helix bundle protein [bacterium]